MNATDTQIQREALVTTIAALQDELRRVDLREQIETVVRETIDRLPEEQA
jgi:hypothetical protein